MSFSQPRGVVSMFPPVGMLCRAPAPQARLQVLQGGGLRGLGAWCPWEAAPPPGGPGERGPVSPVVMGTALNAEGAFALVWVILGRS